MAIDLKKAAFEINILKNKKNMLGIL